MYEYNTVSDSTVALPWSLCEVLWQAAKQRNFQWETLLVVGGGGGETFKGGKQLGRGSEGGLTQVYQLRDLKDIAKYNSNIASFFAYCHKQKPTTFSLCQLSKLDIAKIFFL